MSTFNKAILLKKTQKSRQLLHAAEQGASYLKEY